VASLAFNPNMRQLVSGGLDGDVLVWNFKPSLRAYRFAGHTARGVMFTARVCVARVRRSSAGC
jgi:WD40 repeat protein